MTIVITAPGAFVSTSSDVPEVGRGYQLLDAEDGTDRQNRAFHALLSEYWRSGMHSYPAKSFDEFRDLIKRHLGAGFEAFVYADIVDGRAVVRKVDRIDEVPARIRHDARARDMIRGKLKSWSDYSKAERTETIDKLITEMVAAGVNSKHFGEIVEGMAG